MLKFIAIVLLLSASLFAASWDGTKGSFTVVTFTFSSGTGTDLPGVPVVAGPLVWHTSIFVKCSDPTVSAVRVRLTYRDASGSHVFSQVADLANGFGGVTISVPQEQITTSPVITELRDGASF